MSIKDLSDEEIEDILRKAENTTTSGGQYQQAWNEWQIRGQRKLLKEQRDGNKELVKSTKWLVYATIAVAIVTAVLGFFHP